MIAVDSTVAVAAFSSWHPHHDRARAALAVRPRLPAHAAVETYSVLTRMPPGFRAASRDVLAFIDDRFPDPLLVLSAEQLATFSVA